MIRRSWLFVPGDDAHKLEKLTGSQADVAILDLEDSVAPDNKAKARAICRDYLLAHQGACGPELWVRINPRGAEMVREDLAAVIPAGPSGVVLPKPDSVADVRQIDALVAGLEQDHNLESGAIQLLAIATETALGVANLSGYIDSPDRLWGLTWGAEDLSAELGATSNRTPEGSFSATYQTVRSLCQLAAAAAQLNVIDTVYSDYRDLDGLRQYAASARRDGFSGMMAVHPAQVPVINEAFTPTADEVAFAKQVVDAFERHSGTGVVSIEGRMLDRPHLVQAMRLLETAGETTGATK